MSTPRSEVEGARSSNRSAVASLEMRPLIVWDGDDTLWFVEPLYDAARTACARYVTDIGFDGARWEAFQREIDVRNVTRMGLSPQRFPTSCVEAYDALVASVDRRPDERHREVIRSLASSVFDEPATLADGVEEALDEASSVARMVLVTKGDATVQMRRVDTSGLARFFESVFVVDDKSPSTFRSVLDELSVDPHDAWSVGNSLPSDINPALQAGLSAVWIDAHVWEHERREREAVAGRLFVATTLKEAVRIIREHSALPA